MWAEPREKNIPLDRKARHARLLGEDIAANLLNDGLRRRGAGQLLAVVLIVDIVSDAHKLAAVVGAGQEDHGDAEKLVEGNALEVRRVGLEHELVDADGDRTDEKRVELLVVVVRLRGPDVGELPLEVWGHGG